MSIIICEALTEAFDSVMSSPWIQYLSKDVWNSNTISKDIATDSDILFHRRSPAHHDGI